MKKRRSRRRISAFFLVLSLLMLNTGILYAEGNDGAEPETIEAYTLPIESNNTKDWPQGPKIEAEAAIVMEAETGTVWVYVRGNSSVCASLCLVLCLLLQMISPTALQNISEAVLSTLWR